MVAITKVNLPERARARFEEETNLQRAQKPHDIRGSIPLVDYTNPAKFPSYKFREYPKMPLLDGNRPIVIDESGGVLVFFDKDDEVEFKDLNPELADEIERNAPARALADAIAAKDDEIENLRAQLRNAGIEDERPRNAVLGAARPHNGARVPEAHGEAPGNDEGTSGGLRDTLPKDGSAEGATPGKGNPLKKGKH